MFEKHPAFAPAPELDYAEVSRIAREADAKRNEKTVATLYDVLTAQTRGNEC